MRRAWVAMRPRRQRARLPRGPAPVFGRNRFGPRQEERGLGNLARPLQGTPASSEVTASPRSYSADVAARTDLSMLSGKGLGVSIKPPSGVISQKVNK